MNSPKKTFYSPPSRGGPSQQEAKSLLLAKLSNPPKTDEEWLSNLGLYTRSVMLAKTLYLNELYTQILELPGVIMEFGVWWGSNMAIFGNLRNIYEPYNHSRKIIGFDTFSGYSSTSKHDGTSDYAAVGGYGMPNGYHHQLAEILDIHEKDNVLSNIKKYEIINGDVVDTLEPYLRKNPQTIVSLAYLDLAMYEPTKHVLERLKPHLLRGSILAMDELINDRFPGVTIALKEVLGLRNFRIKRSRFLPDRSYLIVE